MSDKKPGTKALLMRERIARDTKKLKRLLKRKFPCAKCGKPIIPSTAMVVGEARVCFTCEPTLPNTLPRRRLWVDERSEGDEANHVEAGDGALVPAPGDQAGDGVEARRGAEGDAP